ncbi:MAG: TldD/PmbA family protein [bacterium]|nr:TldD/PmbA family protein [bacterium]MCP5067015.1 TldD/PmbA family protein [bacterium]
MSAIRHVLSAAMGAGAHSADAVYIESESSEVRVRGEEIEHVKQARERTLGLRVFVDAGRGGLQQAISSTSDLGENAIERLAEQSVALARETAPDPDAGLPEGGFAEELPELDLVVADDRTAGIDHHLEVAREAEAAARQVDAKIVNSEGSDAGSSFRRVHYVNSAGFDGQYASATHSISCSPIAADEHGAMQTDSWYTVARSLAGLDTPGSVGKRAAERALGQLGARRVPTGEYPVIFDSPTARSLLGSLVGCLSGYAIYRKSSFLAGRLGQAIAASGITVIDDGRLQAGLGSRPFDGEGQPTRRNLIVEGGRLCSYLLDSYSARKLDLTSTGNATRGAGSAPGVGSTNLWLEPGASGSLDDILADTGKGLLVTGMFGQGFNPVTGDFSRGAKGFWIENGKPAYPVEEITIAGNLGDMLCDVDAIGNELLWLGSVAAPPLRIARMTVAGE